MYVQYRYSLDLLKRGFSLSVLKTEKDRQNWLHLIVFKAFSPEVGMFYFVRLYQRNTFHDTQQQHNASK